MSKYYTPKIGEFHVGFEYESSYLQDYDTWVKEILEADDAGYFHSIYFGDAVPTEFRVKYLDKEDIESLGFHTEDNGECYNKTDKFTVYGFYPWTSLTGVKHLYKIVTDGHTVFHGVINNKSELKKVLKMLNIKDE